MIENDEQFKEVFRKYLISKGADINSFISCEDIECDDCVLGNLKDRHGFNVCLREPFKEMEKLKEDIELLKQEISIMSNWKSKRERKHKINKLLKEFCKAFRSSNNDLSELTCYGIDCKSCPFKNMDNFKEWARQAKMKGEVKRDD